MEWKDKNGMEKRVEGENASYCLLRCNREKPQELTKFARLFIIFSYKIIFDSFTAQLFIILSKNILNSFIKQPAQISDGWCSMTSKFSVIFSFSLENCQDMFSDNCFPLVKRTSRKMSGWENYEKSGLGKNVEARYLRLSCQRSWEMTVPRFVHSSGLYLRRKWYKSCKEVDIILLQGLSVLNVSLWL